MVTPLQIKFSMLVSIGQLCSRMCILMQGSVKSVKQLLKEKRNTPCHYSLSQLRVYLKKRCLDIIGEITPNSSQLHKYILTAMNYFTRWIEAIPLKQVNENQVISFLEQNIITRFVVPNSLVFDNVTYFSSLKLTEFDLDK